jgi:dTDP-glucose 4,6-dehydratase
LVIRRIYSGEQITIHADPWTKKPGARHYIHCRNAAAALMHAVQYAENREVFNIVGEREVDNLELVQTIERIVRKNANYHLSDYHNSRPGHDPRYAVDGAKLRKSGWRIPSTFDASLEETVCWYMAHRSWLDA